MSKAIKSGIRLRPAAASALRRQRRKAARPAEIIEAGLAEFAIHGFAGTRLDDVARRAGVAKGTIYLYFRDKEALFVAALRSRIVPVFDGIDAMIAQETCSNRALLERVIRSIHHEMLAAGLHELMRIIIAEGAKFPALTSHYYAESVAKGRALIERIIQRGIAAGEFRSGPATELSIVLVSPAVMMAVWKMTFEGTAPIAAEIFLAAHLDLVFNGIAASR